MGINWDAATPGMNWPGKNILGVESTVMTRPLETQ